MSPSSTSITASERGMWRRLLIAWNSALCRLNRRKEVRPIPNSRSLDFARDDNQKKVNDYRRSKELIIVKVGKQKAAGFSSRRIEVLAHSSRLIADGFLTTTPHSSSAGTSSL